MSLSKWRVPAYLIGASLALGLASPVIARWPGVPVLVLISVLGFLFSQGEQVKRIALASLPLLCAAICAYFTASAVQGAAAALAALKGEENVQSVVWQSWMTTDPLSNPANRAGRWGLYAGAAGGLMLALALSRRANLAENPHGPGRVQGLPLVRKPEKGVHHWADATDLLHVAETGPPRPGRFGGGIVLGKIDKQYIRVLPEKAGLACHAAVFGASGAGKTFSFVFPNGIAGAYGGESLIFIDPKGELLRGKYTKTGRYEPGLGKWLRERGYDVVVFNLKNPMYSLRWNPVMECRDRDEVRMLVRAMIKSVGGDHAYFVENEIKLFTALIGLLLHDFPEEQRHLRAALSLCSWPLETLDDRFYEAYAAGRLPQAYAEAWNGAKSANVENAISGITGKLQELTAGGLSWLTSGHDFALADVAKKKTAMFCVLPVGSMNLKPILTAFYYFLFRRLYELGDANQGTLPMPVRFILDEFANIGQIPGFTEIISTARSYRITIMVILQGLKQLANTYGQNMENILANCDVQVLLRANDMATARHFAQKLGEAPVKTISESKNISTVKERLKPTRRTESITTVPLMKPEQMFSIKKYRVVATVATCLPIFLHATNFAEMREYREMERLGEADFSDFVRPGNVSEVSVPAIGGGLPKEEGEPYPKKKKKKPDNPEAAGAAEDLGIL